MIPTIATTYPSDYALFKSLGLNTYSFDYSTQPLYHVGTVETDEYIIDVSVESSPAKFWRFNVFVKETLSNYKIETGSGAMSDYWNTVALIGSGMIVVSESIKQIRHRIINNV